jgi:hypothetical protein
MNPHPAPQIPGKTEWERFDNAVRKVFSVPADVLEKEKDRAKAAAKKKKSTAQNR